MAEHSHVRPYEITAVVSTVTTRNLEGVFVRVGLVEIVEREGRSIGVKNVTGDLFSVGSADQHGLQ